MNNSKAIPPTTDRGGKECPVCGKRSYSRTGIHPQCAIVQADMPRQKQLAEDRKNKAATAEKQVPKKASWKKKCSHCGVEVHVRLKICDCGHEF
jgi:hypothetical protein